MRKQKNFKSCPNRWSELRFCAEKVSVAFLTDHHNYLNSFVSYSIHSLVRAICNENNNNNNNQTHSQQKKKKLNKMLEQSIPRWISYCIEQLNVKLFYPCNKQQQIRKKTRLYLHFVPFSMFLLHFKNVYIFVFLFFIPYVFIVYLYFE